MNLIDLGSGKASYFGGAADSGVGPQEGLACIQMADLSDWWYRRLFLPNVAWDNSKGLARNLNPNALYCAMRWHEGVFEGQPGEILPGYSEAQIRRAQFIVTANGKFVWVQAADWGPNTDTGRFIDLSPGACKALGIGTDDVVSVTAVI